MLRIFLPALLMFLVMPAFAHAQQPRDWCEDQPWNPREIEYTRMATNYANAGGKAADHPLDPVQFGWQTIPIQQIQVGIGNDDGEARADARKNANHKIRCSLQNPVGIPGGRKNWSRAPSIVIPWWNADNPNPPLAAELTHAACHWRTWSYIRLGGLAGDANGDWKFDFGDVAAFLALLTNPTLYAVNNPGADLDTVMANSDMNVDGELNFLDVSEFLYNLMDVPVVGPEPFGE